MESAHVQRLVWIVHTFFEAIALKTDYTGLTQECLLCGRRSAIGDMRHTADCQFTHLDNLIADIEISQGVVLWPRKDA